MINLTKVTSANIAVTRTDSDGPLVQKECILRDVWINPEFIFMMEEDSQLNLEHQSKGPLRPGLDKRIGFTKIFLADKGYTIQISVVGHPNVVLNKLTETSE